jgi:hypothetical protein
MTESTSLPISSIIEAAVNGVIVTFTVSASAVASVSIPSQISLSILIATALSISVEMVLAASAVKPPYTPFSISKAVQSMLKLDLQSSTFAFIGASVTFLVLTSPPSAVNPQVAPDCNEPASNLKVLRTPNPLVYSLILPNNPCLKESPCTISLPISFPACFPL